jgi:hypothetical protein
MLSEKLSPPVTRVRDSSCHAVRRDATGIRSGAEFPPQVACSC